MPKVTQGGPTGQDHTLDSAFFVPMVPDCSSQSVEVTVLLSWDGFSTEGEDPFQAHPPSPALHLHSSPRGPEKKVALTGLGTPPTPITSLALPTA